MNNSINAAG